MNEEEKNQEINKLSVRNGLIAGGISVVLTLALYIIDPLLQYTNTFVPLLLGVLMIVIVILLAIEVRKKVGGYWSFGQAFRSLIITALFTCLFSVLYSFIIFKYVNPDLPAKIRAGAVENLTTRLEKSGMEQEKIDEMAQKYLGPDFEARLQPTFKNALTNLGIGLLFYAVIDLIIAAIIKKEPPLFAIDPEAEETTV